MPLTSRLTDTQRHKKMGRMLRVLAKSETELADEMARVRERHEADNEVHHMLGILRQWSLEHLEQLHPFGERYGGQNLPLEDEEDSPIGTSIRRIGGQVLKPTPASGALLLRDLRHLYLLAHQVSGDYLIAGTAASAWGDRDLMLALATGQKETDRAVAWLKLQLKSKSPQVLAVGPPLARTGKST
jgi:hypothetical protein